jgi:hypothetical protein
MAANNPQPTAEPPAPANNDTITIAPPAPPQQLPGQVPLTIEPAPPPAPPAPAAPQEPQQPVDWENRYNSMHGRFREASNQLQQATSRIEALENMLASVQAAPRAPAPPTSQKFITSKDEEEMGPEMIDFARRVAREEIAPLTSLQQELADLRQQVQGTSQTMQMTARERMHADLDSSMPNWQTVNHDPEFHAWLALQDPLSGVSRKKLVTDAYAQNNSARVLAIFNRFVSETAAYRPASSNPETAPVVPHVGAQPIPEIWSGKLIEKFYASTVLAAISNTDYEGEIKKATATRSYPHQADDHHPRLQAGRRSESSSARRPMVVAEHRPGQVLQHDPRRRHEDPVRHQPDVAVVGRRRRADEDHHRHAGVLGILNGSHADHNRGATAGKISGSINLGVTGTPLVVVATPPAAVRSTSSTRSCVSGQVLDEQNIPETGRWIVIPTWAATMIKKSELRQAYLSGDSVSMLRNGRLGMVDRFTVYVSQPAAERRRRRSGRGRVRDLRGPRARPDLRLADDQDGDAPVRATFGSSCAACRSTATRCVDGTALAQAIVTKGTH